MKWLIERGAHRYLPYLGHLNANTVLLDNGGLMVMGELRGVPHELASAAEKNAGARVLNSLWRQIHDPTVTLAIHLVRFRKTDQLPIPMFRNDFTARFAAAYRARVLDELYENRWYLSVIVAPPLNTAQTESGRELSRLLTRFRKHKAPDDSYRLAALEDIWLTIARTLRDHHIRRLGIRTHNGTLFSEIAEALRLILYARFLPVGLTDGPLGNAIYTDRAVFERRHYRILHPGGVSYGAIFGLREYMPEPRPGIVDPILPLQMPLVVTQTYSCLERLIAVNLLSRKQNQMVSANDRAFDQITEIDTALSDVAGSKVGRGTHHLSLAVYADSLDELNQNAGMAQSELASTGATVSQESLGNEIAWFAQLPGNNDWRLRPGRISTRNLAHLADFGAFPQGSAEGRWGQPLLRFKTVGRTAYDYDPFVDDVGHTAIFGSTTSGKTTLLCTLLALFDQYMIAEDGIVVFFDKDNGGRILTEAAGGNYLTVRSGIGSGLAPLRGFEDTPYARDCLARWLRALITYDGHGPLPPEDDGRLARAVAATLRLPPALRSILVLRQFLGWRDQHGAGPRLERWCCGGALGWAFDGDEDLVDFDAPLVGIDLTAILEIPEVCEPAAQYLRDRIRPVIDGRRAVISFDEARAYLLSEKFESEIKDFFLTLRKQNGIIIVSTQQPEDLLHGTFGPALVGQAHTMFFFATPTADEDVYRHQLFFTEGEYQAIRERMLPGSRHILIKRRGSQAESVIVDFNLEKLPEFIAVLSGRSNTVRFAQELRTEAKDWVSEFQRRFTEVVE